MDQPTEDLRAFWSHLAAALDAGEILLPALRSAASVCVSAQAAGAVALVAARVEEGSLLSEALADHPEAFGPGAVSIIRGGEHLGMVARAARFVADAAGQCPGCAGWRGGSS